MVGLKPSPGGRWHGGAVTGEGNAIEKLYTSSKEKSKILILRKIASESLKYASIPFPSSAPFGGTFPQGKAFRLGNCSGLNDHQGSALKRGRRGTPTPLMGQPHQTAEKTVQISHNRGKGVLRTLVLSGLLPTFLPREKSAAGGKEGRKHRRVLTKRTRPLTEFLRTGSGGETSHHRSFPFSSGITSFMASMATSIMESSGSLVVKFCIHIPGLARKLVTGLSWPPTYRLNS